MKFGHEIATVHYCETFDGFEFPIAGTLEGDLDWFEKIEFFRKKFSLARLVFNEIVSIFAQAKNNQKK